MNILILDNKKGTLAILLTLQYNQIATPRLELLNQLNELGVGNTAAYRALDTLRNFGLVEESDENVNGRRVKNTELTELGRRIAHKLMEIEDDLNREI